MIPLHVDDGGMDLIVSYIEDKELCLDSFFDDRSVELTIKTKAVCMPGFVLPSVWPKKPVFEKIFQLFRWLDMVIISGNAEMVSNL